MRRFHLILVISAAAATIGCGSGQDADSNLSPLVPGTPVEVTQIQVNPGSGASLTDYSGYETARRLVVTSRGGWEAEWARIWAHQTPVPALPAVDFTREFVAIAASGVHGSGGYRIQVPSAMIVEGVLKIAVVEVVPGSTCAGATVTTSPVSAARIPLFFGTVEFADSKSTEICPP